MGKSFIHTDIWHYNKYYNWLYFTRYRVRRNNTTIPNIYIQQIFRNCQYVHRKKEWMDPGIIQTNSILAYCQFSETVRIPAATSHLHELDQNCTCRN